MDIDAFIVEAFPLEYDKIIKQRNTPIEESIKSINNNFNKELEKIMKDEDSKKK
jgi:hypothetical protein